MTRAISIVAAAVCVLVPAGALADVSETFEWAGGAAAEELVIEGVSGDIGVTVAGDEIALVATKRGKDQASLDRTVVVVEEEGKAVKVRVEYEKVSGEDEDAGNRSGASVDFVVTVPAGLKRLELTTASGNISAAGIPDVKAGVASGDLDVSGAFKKASAHTARGDVKVTNEGEATAAIDVEAVSGDVRVKAALPAAGAMYRVSTVSGNVELALTGETGNYDVDVDLISGKCESGLPLERSGGIVGGSYSGRAGAGDNVIDVSTVSGDVIIATP
ncbi:MAG: DUF4097 family beta strand repeat-containing protein [Candidatus Zixiibacteriota bacterium]|jgi:DUF4097 and DUF4098 domain-containing protein YvlB